MTSPAAEQTMAVFIEMNACSRRLVRHYRGQTPLDFAEQQACALRIGELTIAVHESADRGEPAQWTADDWLRFDSLHDQHLALIAEWQALKQAAEAGALPA